MLLRLISSLAILVAVTCFGLCQAREPQSKLTANMADAIADKAMLRAGHDSKAFGRISHATYSNSWKTWLVQYEDYRYLEKHQFKVAQRLSVYVDDQSGRPEVSCMGLQPAGGGPRIDAQALPTEVLPFVRPGTSVIDLRCADLTGNGRNDYLLVLDIENATKDDLLVLLRQPDGSLKLAAENSKAIRSSRVLGQAGSSGIYIAWSKGFELFNSSGSGGIGVTTNYTFEYSGAARTWLLTRIDEETSDQDERGNGHVSHRVKTRNELGEVMLADLDTQ